MSYGPAHRRLSRARGKAASHLCPCGSPAFHWAYQGSADEKVDSKSGLRYSDNPADYVAMCVPCHAHLDRRASHCPHGHEFTPENSYEERGRRKCQACRRRRTNNRRHRDPELRARRAAAERERYARAKAARDAA